MSGRLFNEKEVREILKKASVSQAGSNSTGTDGISLEELRQIGSELGFDPEKISLAAQSVGAEAPGRKSFLSGRIVLDRMVEGEVSPDDWLGMVAAVQRLHKGSGAITQRGSNYDWAGSDEYGSLALTVNNRNGRSQIRVESNRWIEIFMAYIFIPVFALVFSLSLAKHGHAFAALPVCLFFGALLFGLLRMFRQYHLDSASRLMDRLVDEVSAEGNTQIYGQSAFVATEPTVVEQTARF